MRKRLFLSALLAVGLFGTLLALPSSALPGDSSSVDDDVSVGDSTDGNSGSDSQNTVVSPNDGIDTGGQLDPRWGDELRAYAQEVLGDRYVDIWLADSGDKYLLGVLSLTTVETPTLEAEFGAVAPVELVGRAVSRSQVDQAVEKVLESLDGGYNMLAPDYMNGAVVVGVDNGDESSTVAGLASKAKIQATVDQSDTVSDTSAAVIRPGKPTKVAVSVRAEDKATPVDTLNPAETQTQSPYRAGKFISLAGHERVMRWSLRLARGMC